MLLTQKSSWIWFCLIKSVDVVINKRTLWIWYFEYDLAAPYIQEDSWWKATKKLPKYEHQKNKALALYFQLLKVGLLNSGFPQK